MRIRDQHSLSHKLQRANTIRATRRQRFFNKIRNAHLPGRAPPGGSASATPAPSSAPADSTVVAVPTPATQDPRAALLSHLDGKLHKLILSNYHFQLDGINIPLFCCLFDRRSELPSRLQSLKEVILVAYSFVFSISSMLIPPHQWNKVICIFGQWSIMAWFFSMAIRIVHHQISLLRPNTFLLFLFASIARVHIRKRIPRHIKNPDLFFFSSCSYRLPTFTHIQVTKGIVKRTESCRNPWDLISGQPHCGSVKGLLGKVGYEDNAGKYRRPSTSPPPFRRMGTGGKIGSTRTGGTILEQRTKYKRVGELRYVFFLSKKIESVHVLSKRQGSY